jgi:transcriptional regulator with XRE-family HTH domain
MTTRTFAQAFARVLAATRRARGLSQEDLAGIAQFDRTYPSLLERGLRDLKMISFLRLCTALDRSPVAMLSDALALMQDEPMTVDTRRRGRPQATSPTLALKRVAPRRRRVS